MDPQNKTPSSCLASLFTALLNSLVGLAGYPIADFSCSRIRSREMSTLDSTAERRWSRACLIFEHGAAILRVGQSGQAGKFGLPLHSGKFHEVSVLPSLHSVDLLY